jgi:hypothetical protein
MLISRPSREDHGADGRDQQQQGDDLERDEELCEEELSDPRRRAEVGPDMRTLRIDRLQPRSQDREAELDPERDREDRRDDAQYRVGLGERIVEATDVGDHEHVEDHHRARVDDHLRGRDELGAQQQEEGRERDQVHDQREDAVEGVALEDYAQSPADREESRNEEDDALQAIRPRAAVGSVRSAPLTASPS